VDGKVLQQLSSILRDIHGLSRKSSIDAFKDDAFDVIRELIPFDSGFWFGGRGHAEVMVLHYLYLNRLPAEMTAAFETLKSDRNYRRIIARHIKEPNQTLIYDIGEAGLSDFFKPYDIAQIISFYQRDADLGLYHVLTLCRNGEQGFTDQERQLFESVATHLLDAWRENWLLHLYNVSRDSSAYTQAVALFDQTGMVHFASPAFVELIRQEWPGWRGPLAPQSIRAMKEGSFAGSDVVVRFIPQNDFFLAVARKKGVLDRLTARELEVARHLAKGSNHKEIAINLAVAPSTARNHIARIHAKLGSSKAAHVTKLFMDGDGI